MTKTMQRSAEKKPMTVFSAASLGVGSMIGAGIFALMGEAGAIAGNAVYLSFIIAGGVALLSGYSLARLGARYPSAGGIVEYLVQSFGVGLFSGAMGIMLYISALVAMALVAKTFGSYAVTFFEMGNNAHYWVNGFSNAVVILFVLINLKGAGSVARWEKVIVVVKIMILVAFAIIGLMYSKPELLSPSLYPEGKMVLYSLAITFFAFEGFRVITNAAEDMPDPVKTLPRAIFLAIFLVMLLYIVVALAVSGNLDTDQVIKAQDFALAEAARPVFGATGFTVVAIAALISTASSINANLYAVTNVTYQLAKNGELPSEFGKPIAHSKEGLIISGVLIILMSDFLPLSEIAAVGSISILIIHLIVHLGHFRVINETGASFSILVLAVLATLLSICFALIYTIQVSPGIIWLIVLALVCAFGTEFLLHKFTARRVQARTT